MTSITYVEKNKYTEYTLESDSLKVRIADLGAQVLSIAWKNEDGSLSPLILESSMADHPGDDPSYMGACVGRVANRIKGGVFELNGISYKLAVNNGPNHLHGGLKGFNTKAFEGRLTENSIKLYYTSPDMEEGYPGELRICVEYRLEESRFTILYSGISDRDTLVNLTNHMYFNLSGNGEEIWNHHLLLNADVYLPVDGDCLATGEQVSVEGTVFDYRKEKALGPVKLAEEEQLRLAKGFDHAFLLNGTKPQIVLSCPDSGRSVTISTDRPFVHLYTGNYLGGGAKDPSGSPHPDWTGVALETELCPDSIHIESEPAVILPEGKTFHAETEYEFA